MQQYLFRQNGYMGSCQSYEEAQAVLVGLPLDYTVSLRPGSRIGPQQIRNLSFALEEYSAYQDRELGEVRYFDAGDVELPFGNVVKSLGRLEKVADQIFTDGKLPIFLGGEHLVTYPLVKACFRHYPELVVLHFDAHADLRKEYEGEELSHATVMHKVVGLVGNGRVYQFGIRSGTKNEFDFARKNTFLYMDEIFPALNEVVTKLSDKPVYITIDIDVVDPAYAPGTGTPEPGGCTAKEIIKAVHAMRKLKVVGMDIVEVSPLQEYYDRTAILGAKLVREALLAFL